MNLQIRTGSIRTTVFVISLFCIQNLSHTALYNCENNFTETEEVYKLKYNHNNYHKEYTYIYADPKTPPNLGVRDLLKC